MSTLTIEQQNKITKTLETMPVLCVGVGTADSACSIAAINLALTGKLTDYIPDCMSIVIGRWIIQIQDKMPAEIRNSRRWRSLLPLAAGTGRDRERERLALMMEWVWGTVLPTLTPVAEKKRFGSAWAKMLADRTPESAAAAATTARIAYYAYAAYAARVANYAATAAAAAASITDSSSASAAFHAAYAGTSASASSAASAFDTLYALGISDQYWTSIDPCAMLERLILAPSPQ